MITYWFESMTLNHLPRIQPTTQLGSTAPIIHQFLPPSSPFSLPTFFPPFQVVRFTAQHPEGKKRDGRVKARGIGSGGDGQMQPFRLLGGALSRNVDVGNDGRDVVGQARNQQQ